MISVICVFNNESIMKSMLVSSLEKQQCRDFELIQVDTTKIHFDRASKALNYGASLAKGDVLIFVHQDVEFLNECALGDICKITKSNEFGIAGVAGATGVNKFEVSSSVLMGTDRRQAGIVNHDIKECFALDECLMVVKKQEFEGFDDYGMTWHFYGVEYSHRMLKENKKVLLIPVRIYHASAANSLDKTYFDTLFHYCKKNREIKLVRTCCGYFHNNWLIPIYCQYRKLKLSLKRFLHVS